MLYKVRNISSKFLIINTQTELINKMLLKEFFEFVTLLCYIIKMLKKNCTTMFLKQVFLSLFKTN